MSEYGPRKFASVSMVVVHGMGEWRINGYAYIAIADDGTAWEAWWPDGSSELGQWTRLPSLPDHPEAAR